MKQPVVPELKRRRKFDPAFKQEAVSSWLASGKPAGTIAEELGIQANCLYHWRKALGVPTATLPTPSSPTDLSAENAALRQELDRVRQQRDILKKHWASSRKPRTAL